MHKFLRAAGFSMYTKKKDIEKLLDLLERQPSITKCVQVDEESNVCEMRAEVAPGLGISIVGELNEEGNFEREYYFRTWRAMSSAPRRSAPSRDTRRKRHTPAWWMRIELASR